MTKNIDRMRPHNGRYLKNNDKLINIGDVAEELQRSFTALNAIQTAEAYPVISLKSNYGFSDLRDKRTVTGSGTVTNLVGDGKYTISSGTTPDSIAELRSVERGRYVSGSIAVPGVGISLPQSLIGDEEIIWGYFDEDETEGFGFGCDAIGLFIFRLFEGVEVDRVYRRGEDGGPSWDDPMDGTGPSGDTLNSANVDIYRMPFRWYGAGPVVFEVAGNGTQTDTVQVLTLEASGGNPIVSDPNLPINIRVKNGSNGRDILAYVYGRQFSILGRYQPNRRITGDFRLSQSVGTTFVPLVTFQQKADYTSVSVKTAGVDLIVSNASIIYEIRVGATLTGASYAAPSNIPATETALEFDTSATALTNGQKIYSGVAASGTGAQVSGSSSDIPDIELPAVTPITLCARAISGTATVTSVFRAREEW